MPEEPHKNIEDALKAYAKLRRDAAGGPLDMPPHTRAVLQREIAQRATAPKPAPRRWFEPLLASWPRLAVGAAAVVAAGMTLFMLTDIDKKTKAPMELAQAEPQGQSLALLDRVETKTEAGRKLDEKLSVAQAATGGMEQSAAEVAGGKLKAMDSLSGVKVAARSAPAKAAPRVSALVEPKTPAAEAAAVPPPPALAPATPPPPALASIAPPAAPAPGEPQPTGMMLAKATAMPAPSAVPAEKPAPAGATKAEHTETTRLITAAVSNMAPLSQRLRFAQVASDSVMGLEKESRQQPPPQVLASFQLEQIGDRVVITDADGSVYEGRVQVADAAQQQVVAQRRALRTRSAPQRAEVPKQVMTQSGELIWREKDSAGGRGRESGASQQQLYFSATGTNRIVNQRVVVNGVLSSPADGTLAYGPATAGGRLTFDAVSYGGVSNAYAASATRSAAAAASNGVMSISVNGQVVLPPGSAVSPVPAMPQASAQIEGTVRVGDAPEVELNAVGVGP